MHPSTQHLRRGPGLQAFPKGEAAQAKAKATATGLTRGNGAAAVRRTDEPNLTWPFFIVLLYLFVDFARPQDWLPVLSVLRPGVLALGGGLMTVLFRRELVVFPARAKLMLGFLVLMAIGTPFATNRYAAFFETWQFAVFLFGAVVPLISFVDTYGRLRLFTTAVIMIHVPLALYGITHEGFGIGSFLGDENDFCLALNVIFPYVFFSIYFVRGGQAKFLLILTLGLLLVSITTTASRGGFIGLLAIGAYCWMASHRKAASLFLIALLSVLVLALTPTSYWTEMNTISTSTQEDDTGAQRLYLWSVGWEMFKDHPILGVGPNNYRFASQQYESASQEARGIHIWGKPAHSLFFTLIAEVGILGTLIVVATLVLNFRDNRRIRRAYELLTRAGAPSERLGKLHVVAVLSRANDAALVAYLVTGSFLSVLYYPHLWLQVGIGIVLKRTADALMAEEVALPGQIQVLASTPARPALNTLRV